MEIADPFTGKNGNCMMGFPERTGPAETTGCGKNPELGNETFEPIFQDIGL